MAQSAMLRPTSKLDPSADAAALLRRLGFAVLAVGLPCAAVYSRRAVVVLLPIGAALLVAAGALDGAYRRLGPSLARWLSSSAVMAVLFALGWAALSLLWTPAPGASASRFVGLLGSLGMGLAAYLALPDRMRSANLYLAPIGTALAAAAAIAAAMVNPGLAEPEEDGRTLERGLSVVVLIAWPSVAWLRSRSRDGEAATLVLLVAAAALLGPYTAIPAAFAVGALAYVLVSQGGARAATALAGAMAAIVLLAPLLPFLLAHLPSGATPWANSFEAWRSLVADESARLLTGHGIGAFLLGRLRGAVGPGVPDIPLVQLWYDLGVIGAVAVAAALWAGLRGAAASYAPLLPGIAGAFACAFSLACLGVGSGQAWLPASLSVLVLIFVAAERGQFRTRRPPARDLLRGLSASVSGRRARPRVGGVHRE